MQNLDEALIQEIQDKIQQARILYGSESLYVQGLETGLEWILELNNQTSTNSSLAQQYLPDPQEESTIKKKLVEFSRMQGEVKWYNNEKRYGFISTEEGVDIFLHGNDVPARFNNLEAGMKINFSIIRTPKGYQAIQIELPE